MNVVVVVALAVANYKPISQPDNVVVLFFKLRLSIELSSFVFVPRIKEEHTIFFLFLKKAKLERSYFQVITDFVKILVTFFGLCVRESLPLTFF